MTRELLLKNFGKTSLLSGMPEDFSDYMTPAAVYFTQEDHGVFCAYRKLKPLTIY
jgi:hypothetical protein